MKRALALIIIIAACVAGFLSTRGEMSFLPVVGTSMEPELKAGSIITIKAIKPAEVKVGDVIVFTIPPMVREAYNYPPVIAHRVIRVDAVNMTFRTKGDNTVEDPFTVRPQDLKGVVDREIPYLGFPLLFFQTPQGLIFIIIALCLLTLYLYGEELSQGGQKVFRRIFAPVIEESWRSRRVIERRLETMEKEMASTQQALNSFASTIAEYAEHLKSHTTAIQDLSEASQELKKAAAEQNKVLIRLMEAIEGWALKKEEVVSTNSECTITPSGSSE